MLKNYTISSVCWRLKFFLSKGVIPVDSLDRILTLCVENELAKRANRGETSWKAKGLGKKW